MSLEMLGLVLLGALFAAILLGFPIAFTLMILSFGFGYVGLGRQAFDLMFFQFFATMREEILAAVPLFLFMGYLLERSALMDRLFRAFQSLFAPVSGSLYLAVFATATLFAAATGIVAASVTVIGLMAAPTMRRSGYDPRLSAGAIAAGGTLGILIPPSIMLVVMALVVGVSVVELFAAAIVPGLLLASIFTAYALARSFFRPSLGPPLAPAERPPSLAPVLTELVLGLIPISVLILATLGIILAGLATPTEAAATGALGSLMLTLAYRRFSWVMLKDAVFRTIETSSMILILIAASNYFGAVFSRMGTPAMIANALLGIQLPELAVLLVLMVFIFVLAWPLDWAPIVVIILPILLPLVKELKIDLVWFSTLVAVNLQTAWLSPPVALSAYYLKAVVPDWTLKDIYIGMVEFMVLQLVGLFFVMAFPALALWLPSVLAR